MEKMGRILALDVGNVRTGVAVSDPMQIISQAKEVIKCASDENDIKEIRRIIDETAAIYIVVGLPLDQNGEVGPQAKKVLAFVESLRAAVEIDIVTIDERFSTVSAERILIAANVRRGARKKVIDKVAAQQILQMHLDSLAAKKRNTQH